MKKLAIFALGTALLFSGCNSPILNRKPEVKECKETKLNKPKINIGNYREKATRLPDDYVFIWGRLLFEKNYDINNDQKADISELYLPNEKEPAIYGFDFNQDEQLDRYELFLDRKRDGFNGNEISLDLIYKLNSIGPRHSV